MGEHLDAQRLLQERPRDGPGRHPGSGLAGAGALQHGTGVVEAELEHARIVGVAWPRPGQRRIARAVRPARPGRRGRRPSRFPTSAIRCCRSRRRSVRPACCRGAPRTGCHRVALELHPRAAPVAQTAAGQLVRDFSGSDLDAGDHAFNHGHQRTAMGLPGGDPAQHPIIFPRVRRASTRPHGVLDCFALRVDFGGQPNTASPAAAAVATDIDGPCGTVRVPLHDRDHRGQQGCGDRRQEPHRRRRSSQPAHPGR